MHIVSSKTSPRNQEMILGLILFALGFLLYARAIPYGYAWDDAIVITENSRVQAGWKDLGSHWQKHSSAKLQDQYGFRPVTTTIFALEYGLWGANPQASHAVNALLYGLLCALVFKALRMAFPSQSYWFAAFVSLIYLCHPLHVEAVANIKSRDELLAFLLVLVALIAHLRFLQQRGPANLLVGVLSFLLAFLSKESAVAGLGLITIVVLSQPVPFKRKLVCLLPIPVLAGLALLIVSWSSASTVDVETTIGTGIYQEDLGLGNPMLAAPNLSQMLPTSIGLQWEYLHNFLWPWPLRYYYGLGQDALYRWSSPAVGLCLSWLVFWTLAAIWRMVWRKDSVPLVALGLWVSYMLVYAHFLKPLADLRADRFMLAPSLALALLLVWLLTSILKPSLLKPQTPKEGSATENRGPIWKDLGMPMVTVIAMIAILFGYRSVNRIPVWQSNLALFSSDIPHLEDCARCHVHLAGALIQANEGKPYTAENAKRIEQEYRKAIALNPRIYYGRIELAQFLYSQKRFADGRSVMQDCQQQFPDLPRPYYFLGYGEYFLGSYALAIEHLSKSYEMAPKREDAPYFLAWAYYFNGETAQAKDLARASMLKFPTNDQFPDALSDFEFGTENPEEGFKILKEALTKFHTPGLYQKMIQRCRESGNEDLASFYVKEASRYGFRF